MSLTYVFTFTSAFCRIAIGFVFLLAFGSKARDITQFQHSIARFRLFSRNLSNIAATLFQSGELAVVLCLFIGGELLLPGFVLALFLLFLFSIALFSALVRKLSIPCNCFGDSGLPVGVADVWRNVGLMICVLAGYGTTSWVQASGQGLGIGEWLLAGVSALLLSLVWLHLRMIVQVLSGDQSSSTEQI